MGIEEAQTNCKCLGLPAVGNWGEIKPAAKAGHEWARGQMSSGRARWAWPWPVQGMGRKGGLLRQSRSEHMTWGLSQHRRSGLKFKQRTTPVHGGLGRAAVEFSCDDVRLPSHWFSIQSKRLEARPSACAWSGFESGLQESFLPPPQLWPGSINDDC